jgi:hypothetical protein
MIEEFPVDYLVQNSFACVVTAYLLWERTKFNQKITETLKEISVTLAVVSDYCKKE